ncbi:Acyl-CoA dehydrogenase [Rubellimicrobium mesophilum DSM 19309]|uniref:Acyl-CoA dehydrogenase n=1 Tax=Rubellimicrobium mesophilum DSM 19309 TaxID=442562 RepID=A0A017HP93_9RHOB|nr:DUF2934 domain-containing protein [Rubellimicrobium mesophilum]EYD75978.1 Acyl-CoA dehydrogenase [Rubellimicrobium mesophilum DSM 19309]
MMPELEDLIQKRAHEIWEQEGRPHGRHEEHWRQAAEEVTREVERIKAEHQADDGSAAQAAPKGRQRRAKGSEEAPATRARRTSRAAPAEGAAGTEPGQEKAPARRRGKAAEGQPDTAAPAPRTTRRRASKAEEA